MLIGNFFLSPALSSSLSSPCLPRVVYALFACHWHACTHILTYSTRVCPISFNSCCVVGFVLIIIITATVGKIIKEASLGMRVANDARDLIGECGVEFVHILVAEAAEVMTKTGKRMIQPEHIITALENLDVPEFKDGAEICWAAFKTNAEEVRTKKKAQRLDQQGISLEEMQRRQEALFAQAEEEYQTEMAENGGIDGEEGEGGGTAAEAAGGDEEFSLDPSLFE